MIYTITHSFLKTNEQLLKMKVSLFSYVLDAAGASSNRGSREEENSLKISTHKEQPKSYTVANLSEWKIPASVNRQASPEVRLLLALGLFHF